MREGLIKVSVITVCFNSSATISRTVESVLNQTYPDIEYLVIDGKSGDNTVELVESYRDQFLAKGYTLKVVSEKDNGMYDALNKGVKLAGGCLIGNINADDWYEHSAVEEMVRLYEKERYDLAWSDIRIIKPGGDMIKKARIGWLWTTAGFCHPSMFTRRDILLEYPYACLQMDDDFDMVTRVHKAGKKICTLNKVLANYSFGGMSTEKSLRKSGERIGMKYRTYRRNGYPPVYGIYCFAVETAKYIMG